MEDQASYMGFVAEDLKHTMLEYTTGGRFFASIVLHEGGKMVKMSPMQGFSASIASATCRPAWRIGLMGEGATRRNVELCLTALTSALRAQGYRAGDGALAAARAVYCS